MSGSTKKARCIITHPVREDSAVVLEGFAVSAFSRALIQRVAEILPTPQGQEGNPVLKGGALLAEFMARELPHSFGKVQPRDYDLSLKLCEVAAYREGGVNGIVEAMVRNGFTMQREKPDRRNPETLEYEGRKIVTLRLVFEGKDIDLVIADRKSTAQNAAAEGDTSISSIATDKTGVVYADRRFENDAVRGVYRVLTTDYDTANYSLRARFGRVNELYDNHFINWPIKPRRLHNPANDPTEVERILAELALAPAVG